MFRGLRYLTYAFILDSVRRFVHLLIRSTMSIFPKYPLGHLKQRESSRWWVYLPEWRPNSRVGEPTADPRDKSNIRHLEKAVPELRLHVSWSKY
jgi:hypothetical protein